MTLESCNSASSVTVNLVHSHTCNFSLDIFLNKEQPWEATVLDRPADEKALYLRSFSTQKSASRPIQEFLPINPLQNCVCGQTNIPLFIDNGQGSPFSRSNYPFSHTSKGMPLLKCKTCVKVMKY